MENSVLHIHMHTHACKCTYANLSINKIYFMLNQKRKAKAVTNKSYVNINIKIKIMSNTRHAVVVMILRIGTKIQKISLFLTLPWIKAIIKLCNFSNDQNLWEDAYKIVHSWSYQLHKGRYHLFHAFLYVRAVLTETKLQSSYPWLSSYKPLFSLQSYFVPLKNCSQIKAMKLISRKI